MPGHPGCGTASCNIAEALPRMADEAGQRTAIVLPAGMGARREQALTFAELDRLCDAYAHALAGRGIRREDRTLVLIPPGVALVAAVFALMKIGAVPVLVDPGLGRRAFLRCVADAEPSALLATPLAQALRRLFPAAFRTVRSSGTVGRAFTRAMRLASAASDRRAFPVAPTTLDDEAAIAFTSGSTGAPKGVVYRHGNFRAQVEAMRTDMGIARGEVHLAAVHLFALFNPALGVTTVVPKMDPARPSRLDPVAFVDAIARHRVTFSLGSPTIWRIVSDYCIARGVRLPHLRKVFMFGAPAAPALVERTASILEAGEVFTPFGATEALPLTLISHREIHEQTAGFTEGGAGVCVGHPLRAVDVRIIPITDEALGSWSDVRTLGAGQIGEIVVSGPMVTRDYLHRPEATANAKIQDHDRLWHRMGDIGYLDEEGRLWFCGRKSHRVESSDGLLLPIPCEAIFNRHESVARTALVGVPAGAHQRPVLVVETKPRHRPRGRSARARLVKELLALGEAHAHTRAIRTVLFHDRLPMDVRHHAKIQRERLAAWAETRVG